MKARKIGLSLKYKFLMLLTIIPVASLALYILIATRLFESDKIAYVKDSGVAMARSLAVQFRVEMASFLDRAKPIAESFDLNSQQFSEASRTIFSRQERVDALILVQKSLNGQYVRVGELKKENSFSQQFLADETALSAVRDQAVRSEIYVSKTSFSDMHLVVAAVIGDAKQLGHMVLIGLYRANDLYSAFTKPNIYQEFLINGSGQMLLQPNKTEVQSDLFREVVSAKLPEGTFEVASSAPKLVSYAETGIAGMKVASVVDRKEALSAVNALLARSILFFIALICFTIILSLVASVQLTSTLSELYEATKSIGSGQFDVRVKVKSNDEVGGLADGFNLMAAEVKRLVAETSEKARMQNELATAKIVQDTMFPALQSRFGEYNIVGHFEPASECGGDWWNYGIIDGKLWVWIGDATGHGAPAAMLTSAAKSAATIIEEMPGVTPGKALEVMNRALHETTKGRILMTFFIASIDMASGEVTYASASHDPPYLMRYQGAGNPITKKDLEPLIEVNGPRLGDRKAVQYKEASVKMNLGDMMLFYTDGILELNNGAGKSWGERNFMKAIVDSTLVGRSADQRLANIKSSMVEFRANAQLPDDITLVMCQYGEVA